MLEKHCPKCSQTKPASDFARDPRSRGGLDGWCKPCRRTTNKQAYAPLSTRKPNGVSVAEKLCTECQIIKPADCFYVAPGKHDGLRRICKTCSREASSALYRKSGNQDAHAAKRRARRALVLNHYGHKCACCGERRFEFLAIDHINGGGGQHARERRAPMDQWLIRHGFPEGFQVLCHNCNMAKGFYGVCPHALRKAG